MHRKEGLSVSGSLLTVGTSYVWKYKDPLGIRINTQAYLTFSDRVVGIWYIHQVRSQVVPGG